MSLSPKSHTTSQPDSLMIDIPQEWLALVKLFVESKTSKSYERICFMCVPGCVVNKNLQESNLLTKDSIKKHFVQEKNVAPEACFDPMKYAYEPIYPLPQQRLCDLPFRIQQNDDEWYDKWDEAHGGINYDSECGSDDEEENETYNWEEENDKEIAKQLLQLQQQFGIIGEDVDPMNYAYEPIYPVPKKVPQVQSACKIGRWDIFWSVSKRRWKCRLKFLPLMNYFFGTCRKGVSFESDHEDMEFYWDLFETLVLTVILFACHYHAASIENYREHLAPLLASFRTERRWIAPDPVVTFTDQFGNFIEFSDAIPIELLKNPSLGRVEIEDVDKGYLSYSVYKHADSYYIVYETRVNLNSCCGNFTSFVVVPTLEPLKEFVENLNRN